jgi:cell division septum initiation protein DivIVA
LPSHRRRATDILFLIDKLEKLVQDSRKVPMTNARMIDEKEVLDIIDQLRTTIPEEVRAAKQIQQQRDRVIAQGKEEANRLVDLARQQAEAQVTQHEVVRSAEGRALTIIERAQREANDIRRGADGYAEQVLRVLDERVAHAQHQIRSGLIELSNRRGETPSGEDQDAGAQTSADAQARQQAPNMQPVAQAAGKNDSRL